MLKIVFFIGCFGFCVCDVLLRITVPSSWSVNTNVPATEYGAPPLQPLPPVPAPAPPFASGPPVFSLPPENVEFSGQLVQINPSTHKPSNGHAFGSSQFGQLKTSTPVSCTHFFFVYKT